MWIYCKKDTPENNYDYKCPKICSDDWDELSDPCDACQFKCCIEIPDDSESGLKIYNI